ncbi:conserved unknown protein [Ectocarpus siliculosus]|uniref:EF-hand domain-containing protein n=1 Tax=Ectocarpus siliculosus TaxID=2880 RepID=D7G2J3_ECTSI|nr:conserved unknown protein [Ectocarpus siliculosus]|eukprot:CBJ33427.1 conserved unknown protein [Ectocarpus siliculosus]
MGSSGSTLLPAPDDRLLKSIKILDLSNTDLAKVFRLFCKYDTAQRGCLSLANVYKMLGEKKSIFGDSLFELIGIRDFQELTFSEWLDAITTFCLFEEEEILRFCFFILDREKNGYIEKDEMRMLVNMLYNIDPVKGPTGNTKVAFDKLSVQQDGKIEFWEFELFNKAFPSLFFPAFRLQVKMMQAVWGEAWWGRKKRNFQDRLELRRKHEEEDRLADANRLEAMRQRRIKRKMGACKYFCWPCGRAEYDKMFPRANVVVADPAADEAERLRKVLRMIPPKDVNMREERNCGGACPYNASSRVGILLTLLLPPLFLSRHLRVDCVSWGGDGPRRQNHHENTTRTPR